MPKFDEIDAAALDMLLTDLKAFVSLRGAQIGVAPELQPNVVMSLLVGYTCGMYCGPGTSNAKIDEFMREGTKRCYDALLSMGDWKKSGAAWVVQSSEMIAMGEAGQVARISKGGQGFDA